MTGNFWEASRGRLSRLSRNDVRARFAAYFASVQYSVWDDLQPPHVAMSEDGKSAWMAVHIEAQLKSVDNAAAQPVSFESSWISVYEKRDGRWLMTGISSSVADLETGR